jgi:hypothetical protein
VKLSNEEIIKIMQGVIDNFLKPKFISLGMNATGSWLNSLEARANDGNGEIWGNDYSYWLANGRAPNKDKSPEAITHFSKWAGFYIFKPWMQSKGMTGNPYALARHIAVNGTKAHPNGTDLLEVLESKEVIEYIYKEVGVGFNIQIEKQLKRIINYNFK